MSDQKQLKFQLAVDQNSVQQFSNAISQMTRQLDQLTKSIAAASQAMGGLLGGGHVGGPKPAGQVISTAGFGGGGIPGVAAPTGGGGGKPANLSDIFLKNSQAFKGMADSSRQSMKVMTDALKEAVRQSEQNLARLNKELTSVSSAYNKVAGSAGNFAQTKSLLQTEAAGLQSQIGVEGGNLAKLKTLSSPSKPSFFGAVGDKITQMAGGTPGGGMLGALGVGGAIAGIVALAVKSALNYGAGVREERMLYGQTAASRGSLLGGAALGMWNNDYKSLAARYMLSRDGALREELKGATSDSTGNNFVVGGGLVANALKRMLTLDFKGTANKLSTLPQDIELEKLKDREQMVNNFIAADPLAFMKIQSFYDTAGSRTAQGRRLGYMYGRDRGGNLTNAAGDVEVGLVRAGYDMNAGIGALSAVAGYGGERAGRANMLRVLGAQARGFGGAAQLVGMAAQGAGEGYIQSVFGATRRGDMQAVGQLGVGLLERAGSQGYGQFDQSALFGAMASRLTGKGTDMLVARQMMGGLEGLNRSFTSGSDAFGRAMNIRSVQDIMGGAAAPAKDFVANMPMERMMAIANGAALSPVEEGMGIKASDVSGVLNAKLMNSVRGRAYGAGNTLMGRVASSLSSSGMTMQSWAKSHPGFTGTEAFSGLAANFAAIPGFTPDQAIGAASIATGMGGAATRRLRKQWGLGDVRGGAEKAFDEANAKKLKELNDSYAQQHDLLKALAEVQKTAIDKTNAASSNMTTSAETLNESFMKLSETIDKIIMDRTGNKVQHTARERGAKGNAGNTATAGTKTAPLNK